MSVCVSDLTDSTVKGVIKPKKQVPVYCSHPLVGEDRKKAAFLPGVSVKFSNSLALL